MSANADPDAKFARYAWLRALERTAAIDREPTVTLPVLVDRWVDRSGEAPALLSAHGDLSYRELAERARRYARWGLSQHLRPGDVVALLMANCPDYVAAWLGLTRLGATVALLNTHLGGEGLVHCIRIVAPRCVIAGAEFAAALTLVGDRLPEIPRWVCGVESPSGCASLDAALAAVCDEGVSDAERALPAIDTTALYIYTSGTTGLPKAAKVSHYRLMQWSHWFAGMLDVRASDRMYNCLPLYHSVGGVVAIGATLVGGGSVVIRERFSASSFWRDVAATESTLFQYIGELCRYLTNAPHRPEETAHRLRIACGNGLRPEIWQLFQSRFKIPRILEYYASTEGNFSLYNVEGEPGAIGRIPPFLAARLPVALVRFDVEREAPQRNAEGFCERCLADEVGEAIGLIPELAQRGGRFEGYADAAASQRKVLHDVFTTGDAWYRTGDLMRRDARGFFYFVDRVGDTYRWKGENVSTHEVLSVLVTIGGVSDGVVYGVTVPGTDGRAGMAALIVGADFSLESFHAAVHARLPSYARPVFLRLLTAIEATGTFKPKKQQLLQAGFDPRVVTEPLYVDDGRVGHYRRIDAELFLALTEGRLRL
jgi:fatty-acyl-CoA synthase